MATVTLIGKRNSDFRSKEGDNVNGIKLFYICEDDSVEGLMSCDVWIDRKNQLYSKIDKLDLTEPVEAEMTFEVTPSSKKAKLVKVEPLAIVAVGSQKNAS